MQAFLGELVFHPSPQGRDEKQAPLKTPAWKAKGKGEKITRRRKGKGESMCLVIADHLSARSVSVSWICCGSVLSLV